VFIGMYGWMGYSVSVCGRRVGMSDWVGDR